jgi:hypothetical protein
MFGQPADDPLLSLVGFDGVLPLDGGLFQVF